MILTLGLNGVDGIFHDASATIVRDDVVVASVEEERFNRKKHSNGVPFNAIEFCLRKAGARYQDMDYVGYYLDPGVLRKVFFEDVVSRFGCPPEKISHYSDVADRISKVETTLGERYGAAPGFRFINHHLAHAASAYYISGFEDAAILTLDGSGDRETCAVYEGEGGSISKVEDILIYPYSLGFIYTVISNHLGLGWIEGPGKLMALAGYGKANPSLFDGIVTLQNDPSHPVEIDLSFFDYHIGGQGINDRGLARFGPPRTTEQPLEARHYELAASTQRMLEEAVLHIVHQIPVLVPNKKKLCFAGGVALNVKINRLIVDSGLFDGFFVPPPAGDSGTSLGCALYLSATNGGFHSFRFNVYCGPNIVEDYSVEGALEKIGERVEWERLSTESSYEKAAELVSHGMIVGWAQGKMECGPRALGNRSILADPRNPRVKEELNHRVKHREWFRPYSPSVLAEEAPGWFDLEIPNKYMLIEADTKEEGRTRVPGVVHTDGSSRAQTVTAEDNRLFYNLIQSFCRKTGIPMVLNTSFNRHGEPIVNTPDEALEVLLDTGMDALFLGDYFVKRRPS